MSKYNNLEGAPPFFAYCLHPEIKQSDRVLSYRNLCIFSAALAFGIGLVLGILIPLFYFRQDGSSLLLLRATHNATSSRSFIFSSPSPEFATVSFVDLPGPANESGVERGVYWSKRVERALPAGYGVRQHDTWTRYVKGSVAVKLQSGCGRMQNRLVTFHDGLQGCVRYRQNTDQIQGELFSFYLAQILNLPNLAPSAVSTVDLRSRLWRNLGGEIAAAQWNSNRPVVLTQYLPDLDSASIPQIFRPPERHLNKYDVQNITDLATLVELAQWSDLIVFDYLTANLDRIVNNLYNYQWNVNIMDAPAHNLAKKLDSNLLVFLDNESGLLHGYRLLKKYEIYHSVLLDNLCVFRRSTADTIKDLKRKRNVGLLLKTMFEKHSDEQVKEVLPTLPEKSVKILNERIDRVAAQVVKCEAIFGRT